METHSSILAWKIPWTEEPGRLLSMKESDMTDPHSPKECRLEGELQASWHLVEGGLLGSPFSSDGVLHLGKGALWVNHQNFSLHIRTQFLVSFFFF